MEALEQVLLQPLISSLPSQRACRISSSSAVGYIEHDAPRPDGGPRSLSFVVHGMLLELDGSSFSCDPLIHHR